MGKRTLDTGTNDLLAHVEDGVAVIIMNRPERRNALSGGMLTAMSAALAACETDPDVACVVLTGAGGAFCAGGDVKGMADGTGGGSTAAAGTDLDSRIHAQRLSQRAHRRQALQDAQADASPRIPGAAAGAGLSLALACDLRIAADNAVMTTAFARVGFSGDYGGTYFLSQLVGSAKARELYYLSDRIDMKEAHRARPGELGGAAGPAARPRRCKLAHRLAKGPRVAYRYMKENSTAPSTGADVDDCLDLEATHHVHTGLTEDHREAAKAFVEKREPAFKGR